MINIQLHNQLMEIEMHRKAIEANKRVQEAKTQILIERLWRALYITGFLFIVLLLLVILLWLLPSKSIDLPTFSDKKTETINSNKDIHKNTTVKKIEKSNIEKSDQKPFNGVEYVKENNYIYKRVYKEGLLVEEIKLAPTITESKTIKHEKIPQFSTLKSNKDIK